MFSASRSHRATSAPKRAKAMAIARPMPTAAPVTTATRSVSKRSSGASGIAAGTVHSRAEMKLGVITPVVLKRPHAHARWEDDAGIEEIAMVAEAADRLGYHHVTCSEHVAVPFSAGEMRGAAYWDPLSTFGFLAARTQQIRLVTHVLVLGYHHPLEIAKRYGTLDRVCSGRLILGVGVGTLQEEFELLGAQFEGRGERADDALRALRASLSRRKPVYHGTHYDYEGFVVDPWAVQERVPIWIGGKTARSLRRAVELADGWVPFALSSEEIKEMLAGARDTGAWQERDTEIE